MTSEETTLARQANKIAAIGTIIAFAALVCSLPHWTTIDNAAKDKGARIAANQIWEGTWLGDDESTLILDLRSDQIAPVSFTSADGVPYKISKVQGNNDQLIITVMFAETGTTIEYYLSRPVHGKINGHWINNSERFNIREDAISFSKVLKLNSN